MSHVTHRATPKNKLILSWSFRHVVCSFIRLSEKSFVFATQTTATSRPNIFYPEIHESLIIHQRCAPINVKPAGGGGGA